MTRWGSAQPSWAYHTENLIENKGNTKISKSRRFIFITLISILYFHRKIKKYRFFC